MPLLNSTLPSSPPLSQNASSNLRASRACRCGKAAKARGKAKIEVVRISPTIDQLWQTPKTISFGHTKIYRQRHPRSLLEPLCPL